MVGLMIERLGELEIEVGVLTCLLTVLGGACLVLLFLGNGCVCMVGFDLI